MNKKTILITRVIIITVIILSLLILFLFIPLIVVILPIDIILLVGFSKLGKGAPEKKRPPKNPPKSIQAKVVYKYTEMSGEYVSTYFYATFELGDMQRLTFKISRETYGMVVEGDAGILVYKKTRFRTKFLDFQRITQ